MKTAYGRAQASIRVARGMTLADLAAETGISLATLSAVEVGRRHVDGTLIADIDASLSLSIEDRRRLAEGMAQAGVDGADVRYDVRPSCPRGHRTSALLSVFSDELTPISWARIETLIETEIAAISARVAA